MTDQQFMSELKRTLLERPLNPEEVEAHEESGEWFHIPVIVHRDSGGISANLLSCCGICGAQIVPVGEREWVPISDETADDMYASARGSI